MEKNNTIEVYDPHILDGCASMDMPSVKYVIRSIFSEKVKNYPYAPMRNFINNVTGVNSANNEFYNKLKSNKFIQSNLQNISKTNSKIYDVVFNDKSFVGSQIEIIDTIYWMVLDVENNFVKLSHSLEKSNIDKLSKEYRNFDKSFVIASDALTPVKKQLEKLQKIATKSYFSKI